MAENHDDAYVAEGIGGELIVTPTAVTIRRRGARSFVAHGLAGEKRIRLDQVSAVQFRPAGRLTNGYIQFTFMGGREVASGAMQAARDENALFFNRKQGPAFEEARRRIEAALARA